MDDSNNFFGDHKAIFLDVFRFGSTSGSIVRFQVLLKTGITSN